IVNDITQAYFALFIARKAAEAHLASVDLLGEIADAAQARYAAGRSSQQDAPFGPLDEPPEDRTLPPVAELQTLAIARQPELQRARVEIARGEAAVTSARLDRKPDYSVQGGYQLMPDQTDGLMVKVGVTWPNAPWSRGRIDAKV